MNDLRNWKDINLRLINRGRPSTYLRPAALNQDADLSVMNHDKVGKPFSFSNMLMVAAFAVKCVFKIGYRGAAGNVKDFLDSIGITSHPDFRTIQWRISRMKKDGIKLMVYRRSGTDIDVILDSSGVKARNDGEYRSTKYGKIKAWKEVHIAIERWTHKILNMEITENDVRDAEELIPLMEPIIAMNKVRSATADGAYDSERNFEYCDDNNIKPMIPVHINAINGKHKKKRIMEQLGTDVRPGSYFHNLHLTKEMKRQNQDRWKKESGYHSRSLVETTFSVFKGAFGEYAFSKNDEMKEKELLLKAVVYNRFLA
ncbi:MAG: IS5 family transposase [Rhabdochlamydiaceae bacterium]